MRVGQLQQSAESTAGEGRTLRINGTMLAFKMLSDGLYSDKISSILRELGSNAVDSHTAAGKADVPFEVKLPTQIDPEFYVRDFGIGLSEAEVYDLYLTYFSSSKQESNDFIGGFGIGSKSPFAYTDSFNVTVAKDGTRIAFAVYLDHDAPKVVKLLEEPATPDWPSGLQVGFAVRPEDFRAFSEKASEVYAWFKVPPQVLGACSFERATPALTFPHATVLKSASGSFCSVRVGGCRYVLDKRALPTDPRTAETAGATEVLSNTRIVLEAEIGKIALTGSRESISYDAKGETQRYIVSLAAAAYEDLAAYVLAPVEDASLSPAEQLRQMLRRMHRAYVGWRNLVTRPKLKELMASNTFVGRVLAAAQKQGSQFPGLRLLPGLADELARDEAVAKASRVCILETGERGGSTAVFRRDTDLTCITAAEHLVFLEDLSASTYARLRAFLLAPKTPSELTCVICDRVEWPKLLAALGQPNYRTLEDIPLAAKPEATKKDRTTERQEEDAAARFARLFGSPVVLYSPTPVGDSSLYDLLVNNNGVPPFVVSNEATDLDRFRPIEGQLHREGCSAPVLLMTPTRIKKLAALGVVFRTFEDLGDWLLQQGFFEPLMWHWFPGEHANADRVYRALSSETSFGRLVVSARNGDVDNLAALRKIAEISPELGQLVRLLESNPAVIPTKRYAQSVTTGLPSGCKRLAQLPPEFLAVLTEIRKLVLAQPILQGIFGYSGAPVLIECLEYAQGKKGEQHE